MASITFSEDETFKIMWSLLEAVELAKQVDMLSTMALLDGTYQMVRRRLRDERES